MITNLPTGVVSSEERGNPNMYPFAIIPIRTLGTSLVIHDESVSSSVATTVTLNSDATSLRVIARDYDIYIKTTSATETDACTAANAHDCIPAGSKEDYAIVAGATGLSLIGRGGTADVTIIEY